MYISENEEYLAFDNNGFNPGAPLFGFSSS